MSREDVLRWLAERLPSAPPLLAWRLDELVRAAPPEAFRGSMTETMGRLGIVALDRSTARGETGDEVALDLLAADAFVTYAFEAAAEEDADVAGRAREMVELVSASEGLR